MNLIMACDASRTAYPEAHSEVKSLPEVDLKQGSRVIVNYSWYRTINACNNEAEVRNHFLIIQAFATHNASTYNIFYNSNVLLTYLSFYYMQILLANS